MDVDDVDDDEDDEDDVVDVLYELTSSMWLMFWVLPLLLCLFSLFFCRCWRW